MDMLIALKRPWIWLARIRHRCGYGVHSPFAFEYITRVIYEKAPYYKYEALRQEERRGMESYGRKWGRREPLKVKRLLFRIVNRAQPDTIVDVGVPASSVLYLKAARERAEYTSASTLDELFLEHGVPVDLLYLHDEKNPAVVEEAFMLCAPRTTRKSVFVVGGIGHSKAMRQLWKRLIQHEAAGITFDLYELGIIFFDKTKNKQDYIVNF